MKNILLGIIALAVVITVTLAVINRDAFGSTIQSQEYTNKYIDSTNASSTATTQLKTGYGSVGSVVIASSTLAVYVALYDATSTQATSTSNIIAKYAPSADEGTYQLDVNFTNGLKLDIPAGFNGVYNVTYR
jgi:hypothetical protein